jgi:hypothetical protein
MLRPAAIVLEGITAVGERSAVVLAADRSIYNIREMPVVQAGFATDALRVIPELEVDIDDNIRARGGEPQIYLDGRPLPLQGTARIEFLRSLRADRIDRIEYIPNPSARFEADGLSGIVNIVLMQDASPRMSGSVSLNAGTRGTQGASGRLNYQIGQVTFFGGGSLNLSQQKRSTFDLRQNLGSQAITYLEQNVDRRRDGISGSADMTVEWKTTQRSTFWGIIRGNAGDAEEDALYQYILIDQEQSVAERYERENSANYTNDGFSTALGYRRVVETQRDEFSAEVRYTGSGSSLGTRNYHFAQTLDGDRLAGEPGLTHLDTSPEESLWSAQADLSKPLGATTRIDIGYRTNFRTNEYSEDGDIFTPSTTASNTFDDRFHYTEDSHAGYVNVEHRIANMAIQGGLRAERLNGRVTTNIFENAIDTRHSGFFPSANVAYDFGGGKQLRLSYANRVQRPSVGDRNPINNNRADPFNIAVGNPGLRPAEVHQFEGTASWTGRLGTFRLSPYLTRGKDFWDIVRSVDEQGISTVKPMNIATVRMEGVNLNVSLREWGRISGNAAFNAQHLAYDVGTLTDVQSDANTNWNLNASITTRLTPALAIQTMGRYSPGSLRPYGRTLAMKEVNLALTQRVFGNRGTINLNIVDPFNLSQSTITNQNANYVQTSRTNNRVRRATLAFSYNFGQAPQSNRRVVTDETPSGF